MRSHSPFIPLVAACGALAIGAPSAHANLDGAEGEVEMGLNTFMSATVSGKESGHSVAYYFTGTYEECTALIAKGKELGIKGSQVMYGNPDEYLFKRAGEKCEEYRTWKLLTEAAVLLDTAAGTHGIIQHMKAGEVTGEWANAKGDVGKQCIVDVDAVIKRGAPADLPVKFAGVELTLTEGKAKFCQGLIDWAKSFSVQTDAVQDAEAEKIRAKYTKVGIGGDRLKMLVENDGTSFYGKGCDAVISDVKKLKKAKVLFYWTDLAYGAGHGVRRYQFKGDKLVKETYREFSRPEAAYKWCK